MDSLIRYISSPKHIVSLSSDTFDEAVLEVLYALFPKMRPSVRWSLCKAIRRREMLRSTVLPNAVAFPRAESDRVKKVTCGVGIPEGGAIEDNPFEAPVQAMFVTVYPTGGFDKFAPVLAGLARFSQDHEKMAALKRMAVDNSEFETIRDEAFPWGTRGRICSQLLFPIHRIYHRT